MKAPLLRLHYLAPYEIETVVCYHGGLYTEDVNARIAELAAESAADD